MLVEVPRVHCLFLDSWYISALPTVNSRNRRPVVAVVTEQLVVPARDPRPARDKPAWRLMEAECGTARRISFAVTVMKIKLSFF